MRFSAALIAGGRSSRMGTDKAFLDWNGRPLWRHQLDTLNALGAAEVFVCGRAGQEFPGVSMLRDPVAGMGPLAGIEQALAATRTPFVLVLAVDLPGMTAGFLRGRILAETSGETGAVPMLDGFYEPLAAVYPVGLLGRVREQLGGTDRSLQSLCRWAERAALLRPVETGPAERALFANVNSRDDLEALRPGKE